MLAVLTFMLNESGRGAVIVFIYTTKKITVFLIFERLWHYRTTKQKRYYYMSMHQIHYNSEKQKKVNIFALNGGKARLASFFVA